MKPKSLLNLILLAVLAVLAAVAFLEPGEEKAQPVYLTDIDTNAINRFELSNGETLVFEKQNGDWRLTAPFAAPANSIRVQQLLNIVRAESKARYPLKPEEQSKFELTKPKAVLTVGQTKLVFGGFEPIDMLRYVQIGDTLHLVTDDFSHHLSAKATDYVDKKLLPEDAKLKEIKLPGLSAKKGDKGVWVLEPPGDAPAAVELTNAWQSARAIEIKRHDPPAQGEPIHIGLEGGQAVDFVIVQREPDLLLVRPDWKLEYLMPDEVAMRLLSLQKPGADEDKDDDEDSESPLEDNAPPDAVMDADPGEDVESDGE
jgi:hypothetical protein